ncbi:hypothetical protein SO802_031936 [Lithocarpus litseifolius]|uniref:RNase H type-1 domain-containing protein n=1 Tax=Lithocarpus litseifolius TaxID=425828 RepID=A0AAW2BSG5_9ROSI
MKNLQRRCVVQDSICPFYSQHEETVLHAIWSCPELALVWEENNLWNFRNHLTFCDFPQLLHHILDTDCSGELFAMQAWTVWLRRNKVRTAPPGFPLNLIAQRAYDALLEFRTAQQRSCNTRPSARTVARWSPPTDGWYKANFDAATFQEEGRAAELGFDRVVFEGDCQAVMKALTDTSPPLATFGLLIQDAQVLAVRFSGVRFQYASRDSNKVAHNLARYARHITDETNSHNSILYKPGYLTVTRLSLSRVTFTGLPRPAPDIWTDPSTVQEESKCPKGSST